MKKTLCSLFLAGLMLVGTSEAFACSCDLPSGPDESQVKKAKASADAVFVGRLVKLVEPKNRDGSLTGEVIAEFEIERAWTDVKTSRITVYTTNICCICGFPFHKGMRYIVYASGKQKLHTTICTRTTTLTEEGSPDERYLGIPVVFEKGKKIS